MTWNLIMQLLLACNTESGTVYKIRARARGTSAHRGTLKARSTLEDPDKCACAAQWIKDGSSQAPLCISDPFLLSIVEKSVLGIYGFVFTYSVLDEHSGCPEPTAMVLLLRQISLGSSPLALEMIPGFGKEAIPWVLLLLCSGSAQPDAGIYSRPPDDAGPSPWRAVFAQGKEEIWTEQVESLLKFHSVELKPEKRPRGGSLPFQEFV
ncbi:hypothetical protein E5288_WYG007564 [Bos mutus]|uniref:Uncharacterized protein n=1 Tax=Bos mutus TaxID=72004 RepID=A0A6B0RGM0_9CETA|nr:hypothetical protein [Bos mutus]